MSRADPHIRRLIVELEDPATRQRAVEELAASGEPAVGPLARVMREGDLDTRQAAARALAQIGAPAVETLCGLLADPDWSVNESAASALTRIGPLAIGPLCRTLTHADPRAAHLAAESLAKMRKPASEALCRSLGSPDPMVRIRAAGALERIGTGAVPALTRAFRRPEIYLGVSHGDRTSTREQETRWLRRSAVAVLGKIGGSAIEVLCGELGCGEEERRQLAADTLLECGETAIDPLCRLLELGNNPRHRQQTKVLPGLAAQVLGRIGHQRALGPLLRTLDSPHPEVRSAAARALAQFAQITPDPELRAQLPRLRWRLVKLAWINGASDEWQALETAIRAIETATADVAAVPLPAASPASPLNSLPRPAGSARANADSLPVAAAAVEPPGSLQPLSPWIRLIQRLRRPR